MADQKDSGFNLPAPVDSAVPAATPAQPPGTGQGKADEGMLVPAPTQSDTGSRDLMFAGGALLVFMIVFFVARNAYANMLVSHRVSPRSANAAGWWLFILLLSLATIGVLAVVNQVDHVNYLTLVSVLPLALVGAVALILMLLSGRRR